MEATDAQPPERVLDRNLVVIFAVTFIGVMGVSSISPIIPDVGGQLGAAPSQFGLLITFFTLPGIVLTPLLGVVADRWGRKQVLIPSLLVFAAAGTACAFAPSFHALLGLRFLQGAGAAALGSLNVTLIGDLYKGRARAAAMGYNGSVLSLCTAAFPLVGGILALLGWRAPFLLPAFALPVAILAVVLLDNPPPEGRQPFGDYLRDTMRAIRRPEVLAILAASLLTFILLFGAYLAYLSVLLSERFGASPLTRGLLITSGSLTTALVAAWFGRLSRRFALQRLIHVAFLLYAVSLALIPLLPYLWLFVLPAMIFGAAQGINLPSILTLLAGAAPTERRGFFMSINGMMLRIGQSLGPVLMGIAVTRGLNVPFWVGVAIALASAAGLALVLRPSRARAH